MDITSKPTSKILMVIGMGRSGTSVITQWINKCGLPVGDTLLGKAIGNVEGHFEDEDFLKIHEEILLSNNLSSTGLQATDCLIVTNEQKQKITNIIDNKNKMYKQWGWKEPRTVLFLPVYKELIPDAKYLIIVRDYKAVIDSLLRRDFAYIHRDEMAKLSKQSKLFQWRWQLFYRRKARNKYYTLHAEKYLKVCINYNQEIIKSIHKLSPDRYIVVSYLLLKSFSKKVFDQLTNDWKFNLKYVDFNDIYKENLMTRKSNIKSFIKDKSLLYKAKALEDTINSYSHK